MTDARPCCGDGPALSRRGFLGAAAAGALPASIAASAAQRDAGRFLLGLEEHFVTPELMRLNGIRFPKGTPRFGINEVSAGRIAEMDAAGIGLQVLAARPERFRAFAILPLCEPGADDELEFAEREDVRFRPLNYTHGDGTVARIGRFVSINSALEIDLAGQMNAEMIRGTQATGTGGSVDFMRVAAGSPAGRAIVALGATASGERSRASCRDSTRATRRPRSEPN